MLESYTQTSGSNMTKEKYFEMCEMLGTDPVDSEIPFEFDDFPVEIQEVLEIYKLLRDEWDTMNGIYLGKNFSGIIEVFDLVEVDRLDQKLYLNFLHLVDNIRKVNIKKVTPEEKPLPP